MDVRQPAITLAHEGGGAVHGGKKEREEEGTDRPTDRDVRQSAGFLAAVRRSTWEKDRLSSFKRIFR